MSVGLGTGSTAIYATRLIAKLYRSGQRRDIVAFATSRAVCHAAVRMGIPMMTEDLPQEMDLTIDGADEVDPQLNLIKGGGGARLREKIVAQASRREIIIVDESKLSNRLQRQKLCGYFSGQRGRKKHFLLRGAKAAA